MSPAAYRFFPWVTRGAAVGVTSPDTGGPLPARARLDVGVDVNGVPLPSTTMRVAGPGDVVGIDLRQIVRTEPVAGSTDFEPNLFPHVEFAEVALPWLFTPASPDRADERLRPWCVLVVVAVQEGVSVVPGSLLEVLEILRPAVPDDELPDLADSWAWVHAQVVAEEGSAAEADLTGDERLSVARLICPRRLEPLRSYHACLVPAFDAGVVAGLGGSPEGATIEPAWKSGDDARDDMRLPVYLHWEFSTGPVGDFEALVRRLRPGPVPDGVGRRPMYIGSAGSGMPTLASDEAAAVISLEGALQAVNQQRDPIPQPPRELIEAVLSRLANAAALRDNGAQGTPPLGAPLYGGWPAQAHTVAPNSGPSWLSDLNTDPRDRAAAAAGVRAIQARQEELVHSAWEQLGAAQTGNLRHREMQLARAAARSLHRRHIAPMGSAAVVQLMGPASSRLRTGARTLAAETRDSALVDAALTPQFRKAIRPTTAVRRSGMLAATARSDAIERLNARTLEPRPVRVAPDGAVLAAGMRGLRVDGAQAVLPGADDVRVAAEFAPVLFELAQARSRPRDPDLQIPLPPPQFVLAREVDVLAIAAAGATGIVNEGGRPRLSVGRPSVHRLPIVPLSGAAFDTVVRGRVHAGLPGDLRLDRQVVIPNEQTARRYVDAVLAGVRRLHTTVQHDEIGPRLKFDPLARTALEVTDPVRRAPLRAQARVVIPSGISRPPDPLAPIRGAPVFPVPLVELVGAIDREHVVPGLHLVEPNTVGILEINRRFIEAVLVGANHEIGRELAWRQYPVERRATFFRRFWARPPGSLDIPPIAEWSTGELGDNALGSPGGELILIIRGDLLRRYPGTIIYASQAEFVNGRPTLIAPPIEKYPILSASLPPDIAMRGFALTAKEAMGAPEADGGKAGWFFILASQPTEPRFGLDVAEAGPAPPTDRADLNWGHFAVDGDLTTVTHATVGALSGLQLGQLTWGQDAAHQAAITLQDPVRIVVHARHLLRPPDA